MYNKDMENLAQVPMTTTEYENRIAELEKNLASKDLQIANLEQQMAWLTAQIMKYAKNTYGQRSEKTEYVLGDWKNLNLFNEAEVLADPQAQELTVEEVVIPEHTVVKKPKKYVGQRNQTLEGFEVEEEVIILPEEQRDCPECGEPMHEIGREIVRKEIEIVPAKIHVKQYVQVAYGCRPCEQEGDYTPIVKTEAPPALMANSIASASAVAYIMFEKYCNAMPLYRQEKNFELQGLRLPRQTMANWVIVCAQKYLMPVYNQMHIQLIQRDVIQADETTVQVLKEDDPNRKPTTDSYMWVYRSAQRAGSPIVLFEYQPTRAGEHPKQFLGGYKGYVICDGYIGYNNISEDVKLAGCFQHCRSYYVDAVEIVPKEKRNECEAAKGLAFCKKLFDIERALEKSSNEERYQKRLKQSKPVLDAFWSWVNNIKDSVLPKTRLGQAVTYTLNQWKNLTRFLEDGRLDIHNNKAENSIRPFAICRKNFLFCDTANGARASAVVFSILQTAKENGLHPLAYMTYLLDQMRRLDMKATSEDIAKVVEPLLPWSPSIPQECKFKKP